MRHLLANYLPRAVIKRKRILKLLRKSAAANRRDVEQQTVLRIIKQQTLLQFARLMNALADHPRGQHGRRDMAGLISHQAVVRAGDQTLDAIRSVRRYGEDPLRR